MLGIAKEQDNTVDDIPLGTPEHDDEWDDIPGLPKPIMSMPVSRKGNASSNSDDTITLWIPSNIPTRLRSSACVGGLIAKEIVLRVADCSDSLHNIRRCLRELSAFSSFKRKNIDGPGQYIQTRALGTLKALHDKRDRYVARYCRSRAAWLSLDPHEEAEGGKWRNILRSLEKADLTFPGDDEEPLDFAFERDAGSEDEATTSAPPTEHSSDGVCSNEKRRPGEGYKHLTWIWRVQKQDVRDIPGLNRSASDEEVYKCKIYFIYDFQLY